MNVVMLLSGGSGTRIQSSIPKQHIIMDNHQIIEYTLTAFSQSDSVDAILVVTNPLYSSYIEKLKDKFHKLKWIVDGGGTRIESVDSGIRFLNEICKPEDKVIISDSVRPCITSKEISGIINRLDEFDAVTSGVEVYETILKLKNGSIESIIPREGVVRQTSPEGYVFRILERLYIHESKSVISRYRNIGIDRLYAEGCPIGFVKSSPLNFKITTQDDIELFEAVLKQGFERIISR